MKIEKKCPKCGKQLKLIHLRAGDFYGHSYTLRHVMTDKPMCDYNKLEVKGNW